MQVIFSAPPLVYWKIFVSHFKVPEDFFVVDGARLEGRLKAAEAEHGRKPGGKPELGLKFNLGGVGRGGVEETVGSKGRAALGWKPGGIFGAEYSGGMLMLVPAVLGKTLQGQTVFEKVGGMLWRAGGDEFGDPCGRKLMLRPK